MIEMEYSKDKSNVNTKHKPDKGYRFEMKVDSRSQNTSLVVDQVKLSDIQDEWEKYVEKHPASHFFNHPLWVKALESEFNHEPVVFVCRDTHSRIKGILPLMPTLGVPFKKKELISGRRLSSLPRTPLGGFLFDDKTAQQLLVEAAIKKVSEQKNLCLQLKSYSSEINENIEDLNRVNWRSSFYLKLPDCPSKIRFGDKKHHHKIKWAVNKATNLGITVREIESEKDLIKWYVLYLETVRYHMVPARPYRFFKFLYEKVMPKGLMKVLLAEGKDGNEKKLIAGSVFFFLNDTVFYSFNGRNQTGLINHANDLIQWEAIHKACEKGFKYYDMGEVSEGNASLAQFKAKWGCEAKQIYHYYCSSENIPISENLECEGNGNFIRSIWRKLPLKVTQEIGIFTNRFL